MAALLSLAGQLTRLPVVSLAPVVVIRWVASRILWDLTTHRIEVVSAVPADSCNRKLEPNWRPNMNSSPMVKEVFAMVRLLVLCFKGWECSSSIITKTICMFVFHDETYPLGRLGSQTEYIGICESVFPSL